MTIHRDNILTVYLAVFYNRIVATNEIFIHTLAVPWGRVSFQFDACGVLVELKLDSKQAAGMHGKRPAGAPSASALKSWLAAFLNGTADAFPGQWKMPGTTSFQKKIYLFNDFVCPSSKQTLKHFAAKRILFKLFKQ